MSGPVDLRADSSVPGGVRFTKPACLLFDLDGTVLDTRELIISSFQYTFTRLLGREMPAEAFYPYFGEPLADTMARYAPDRVEELLRCYREYNHLHHDRLVKVFPGVPETLAALDQAGVSLGVVTSKLRRTSLQGLKLFGLERRFQAIITCEDVLCHKPHPEPINSALEQLGMLPDRTWMIGDSPQDLACARNAGVTGVAVGWSVHPLTRLAQEKPAFVLSKFSDLMEISSLTRKFLTLKKEEIES